MCDYISAKSTERINEIQEKQVMEKCTDTVVDWMIRCNVINEADKELYKYALHSLILLVSPLILAGGIGFGLGSVKHGVALIFRLWF